MDRGPSFRIWSALTDHAVQENHVISWSAASVIDRESDRSTRGIKEAVHVYVYVFICVYYMPSIIACHVFYAVPVWFFAYNKLIDWLINMRGLLADTRLYNATCNQKYSEETVRCYATVQYSNSNRVSHHHVDDANIWQWQDSSRMLGLKSTSPTTRISVALYVHYIQAESWKNTGKSAMHFGSSSEFQD